MPHLTLTDNNIVNLPSLPSLLKDNLQTQIHAYEDLQTVSGKTLKELCTKESSLLVFPDCLNTNNDGIEELVILDLVGSPKYSQDNKIENVDNVKIKTGNLMGFIGFNGKQNHGTQVEIRSRFTENTNNNGQDYFLHYMLEKVFRINLFEMNYSHSKNDGFDLLFLIFPHLLKRALRQGIFRTYRTFHKNDAAVKGVIDINRHIKQNTPFNGKVAYRSREYSADNDITQLIRHTIEFLKQKEIGKSLLNSDNDTKDAVKQIVTVTDSSYCFQNRGKVIHNNLRPVNHPYYSTYKYLQQLCLLILRHQSMQYSQSSSPIYGILFDGAWLWEEYLATILCNPKLAEKQFIHPSNKNRKGGIRLFDNAQAPEDSSFRKCYRRIYPDFYRENSTKDSADGIILDAKYKHLENGLVRDDLYQIISYMHTMKISTGGFIYPVASTRLTEHSEDLKAQLPSKVEVKNYKLANDTGTVCIISFPIPQNAENYKDFSEIMKITERKIIANT